MTERDIIRRLENSPVPPPPEDLAARIINEIPEEVQLHPEMAQKGVRRIRPFHRRPAFLAAAAAMTVALTGAVTWELQHRQPTEFVQTTPSKTSEETKAIEVPVLLDLEESPIAESPTVSGKHEVEAFLGASPAGEKPASASIVFPEEPASTFTDGRESTVGRLNQVKVPDLRTAEPRQATAGAAAAPSGLRQKTVRIRAYDPVPIPPEGSKLDKDLKETEGRSRDREFALELKQMADDDPRRSAKRMMPRPMRSVTSPVAARAAEPNDQAYPDVFFEHTGVNPFVDTEDDSLSTFGLDVDTASYTIARRYLQDGNLPPHAAIRTEEFVNFFDYGDPAPRRDDFRLTMEGAPSVFAQGDRTHILRMAIKARDVDAEDRPPAVLVFCVDVSGSMKRENRLGLVKKALYELLENLHADDHVGLVIYGSTGRILLKPSTNREMILQAIDRLQPGGSTNAEEGLSLAYEILSDGDDDGRLRRVILCSDGVANVGNTGPDSILKRIRAEAADGIELTTVGFGMGNYNDVLMEGLADAGNGRYAYVDTLEAARRIFVEELTGTLMTLGHDAKAQVDFNSEVVSRWRLIGYENRDIADHLFRDPTVDAGEIGAGHSVTAMYEVKLRSEISRRARVATLRYRYRPMNQDRPVEMEETLRVSDLEKNWEKASPSLKLASLVAEFAEILKGAYWAKDGDLEDVLRHLEELQSDFAGDPLVADLVAQVARAADLKGGKAEADFDRD